MLLSLASDSLALILSSLSPTNVIAVMLSPMVLVPFLLSTGFFIPINLMPQAMRWLPALSPHRYLFSSMMIAAFQSKHFFCADSSEAMYATIGTERYVYCPFPQGSVVLKLFGMHEDTHALNIPLAMLLVILLRIASWFALRKAMRPRSLEIKAPRCTQ